MIAVRPATTDDARAIAHVQVATWQSAYRGIVADDFLASLSEDDRTLRWSEILQQPEQATFVAEAEAAGVVGFVNGGPQREVQQKDFGELYAIYVLPQWHKQGIGRQLVAAFSHWLVESGFATMTLWVLSANPHRSFYERLGGTVVGKKDVPMGVQTFEVLAYAWDDLRPLADGAGGWGLGAGAV